MKHNDFSHQVYLEEVHWTANPSIHIHLLNDDTTHQIKYKNNRNVSTIAYITYEQ